jgi:hypothetical protein
MLYSAEDDDSPSGTGSDTSESDSEDVSDELINDSNEIPAPQRTYCVDSQTGQKVVFSNGSGKLLSVNRCLVADLSKVCLGVRSSVV